MRKSNLIPKFISVMLTLSLLFSMVPLSVSATTENDSNTSVSNEMSVSGVNSLGNMIAKTLGEQHTEVAENNGNSIYSITVEENIATASFQTDIDATLVVAVYNEAADALIASGTVEVSSDDNEAEVEIEIDTMPQYFYLKGFLIDSENYKPICTAYESPNYTEEMQEFFAKTTEDFAQDSLLNLDDDITNNFAVYKDSVIMLATDESGTNTLSYDLSTDTYTIENADEIALAMQAGDIFVYNHESVDAVIVKIAEITTDGTTATITGADTVVEEVFEYVRIEATGEKGNYTEDSSTLDPDLTPYPNTYRLRRGVDVTASETISEKYEVSSELGDNCKITGTLTFGLTASAKVYVSPSYSYAEVKFDYSIGATLTFEGEASKDYKLKGYNLPLAYGAIIISITPTVKFESSVNITCSGTLSGTVGACVDTDSGYRSLNKDPEFKPEFKAEGKIYIGIALEAKVSVLAVVAQASVTGELGVEVEGKLCGAVTFDDNEAHDCKACIDGDINAKISVTLSIGLLELESLTYTKPFEYTTKIADFYYSLTYNEFAFTPCPHLRYKVTVVVNDKNNFPVESALVNSNYYTDSNGVATLKLPNGTYNISASHNDLTASQQVTVKDSATTVILTLGGSSGSGSGENIPGGGFVSNGDVVSIATGSSHSAAVTKDGTLYMWGANNNHCLGDNVTTTAHSPIKVSGSNSLIPENSVKSVSLGYQHTAVILTDGSLYTWGYNNCGQLGNGNTGSTYLPQKIMENVKSVSLSYSHSAAITTDGSLYMWGSNDNGQLGNGTTNNSSSPIKIMDNVKSVSLGYAHSAAVTEDGVLYVWGFGTHGQIGNNTYSDNYRAHTELSPVKIMENVASVSLGNHHSAAITTDSNLYVWGYNYNGEIGDGTTTRRAYPVKIANNIAKVSLGRETTFAFTNDGALYGWGYNYHGQLGNGTTTNVSVPQKIMSDVVMAAPSVLGAYTAILTSGGDVYTCGHNAQGQLGTGTTDNCYTLTKIDIYDHTPYLTAADNNPTSTYGLLRATAVPKRTATFNGLMANATYNFYSIKTKKAENVMSSENLLYVDQVTADQNGSITISYYPDEAYSTPFEFVANLTRIHMQNTEITVPEYYYNGTEQRFNPVIKFGEYTLTEGIDYEFEGISKATASGEYVVNICGKGNFVGKISTSFVINKVSVANLKVEGLGEIQYSGNALTPEITVTDGNRTLIKDTDYTVEYQNNTNLGIGIAVVKGIDNYTDRQICWFDIVECELTAEMIKLNTKQLYTGQAVTPEITVSNGENTLIKDIDYTVEFKNNVEIGTARAVITGMGNYTGSVEMEFEICEGVYGDADRDCDVNVNDVTAIQLHLAQLKEFSELELKYCDVDGDGAVTITDATYVQLYLAGYIENFSVM